MIHVNNKRIIVIQPPSGGRNRVTMYAGGLFNLRANDVITVLPDGYTTRLYMCADCSYFGAFLIWRLSWQANHYLKTLRR